MRFSLQTISLHGQRAAVDIVPQRRVGPPGSHVLLSLADCRRINCHVIGLEVLPVYRDGEDGDVFPDVLRRLHRGIGKGLKRAFFAFALHRTNVRPQHFYALGRRTVPKLVWEVDRHLSEVADRFNLLWQVTPINAESAWQEFLESGCQQEPAFQYRPLSVDPLLLKRQLNSIATERLADATLSHLFRQTQDELDRLITMLADIGTPRFLPGSLQVFGNVEPSLLDLAQELLSQLSCADQQNHAQLVEPPRLCPSGNATTAGLPAS